MVGLASVRLSPVLMPPKGAGVRYVSVRHPKATVGRPSEFGDTARRRGRRAKTTRSGTVSGLSVTSPYGDAMTQPPPRAEVGQQNSRIVRSARSKERAQAVWEDIQFIAWRDRPKSQTEFADILNEEDRPTPTGKGRWSRELVKRYMSLFGSSVSKLRAEFPERTDAAFAYPAEVYEALRSELFRLNATTEANGRWITATQLAPSPLQSVDHPTWGFGYFVEPISLAVFRCRFTDLDARGDIVFVDHDCRAIDLKLFVFHRSAEERRLAAADYWQRLIKGHEKGFRRLVNGWHLKLSLAALSAGMLI